MNSAQNVVQSQKSNLHISYSCTLSETKESSLKSQANQSAHGRSDVLSTYNKWKGLIYSASSTVKTVHFIYLKLFENDYYSR